VRYIGLEARCFVLSCNQFTRRRDLPADLPSEFADDPDDVVSVR
jgi:nitrilase